MKKESIFKVIEACALLVLGVLFCVSLAWAGNVLSIILGSSCIAIGAVIVVVAAVKDKSVVSPIALGGLLALTLGIFFIVANIVMQFINSFVPYVLIVFGSALFVDAFLAYFVRKEKVLAPFIIKLVIGAALITVGALLLTISDFAQYISLIIGIALILIAITNLAVEFIKADKTE